MKAKMAALVLILSFNAQAGEKIQVRQCGDTLRQVANIINQQFRNLDAGEIAACFQGNWGYGIVIDTDKTLSMGGYDFAACPQANGQIYLHKKGNAKDGGLLNCTAAKMTAIGFKGDLALANGDYPRKGTWIAGRKNGRN